MLTNKKKIEMRGRKLLKDMLVRMINEIAKNFIKYIKNNTLEPISIFSIIDCTYGAFL